MFNLWGKKKIERESDTPTVQLARELAELVLNGVYCTVFCGVSFKDVTN